ncbi:hypothetical protein [Microlunatus ginsengisoli]|uniref:hypothetical protein n=1 Tax=Microlunatus ginsengisoli TaxID=363863 RepID=UPI0031D5FD02
MSTQTHPRERRPAGSPAGGQFAPTTHPESDLDLEHRHAGPGRRKESTVGHRPADAGPGTAGALELLAAVRAGIPDADEGTPATLTRRQVHGLLSRHLVGLRPAELAEHLSVIDAYADRVAEVEAVPPEQVTPDTFGPETGYPVDLDAVRDQYGTEADALQQWHAELKDWWAANLHVAVHTAHRHSVYARAWAGVHQ